MGGEGGSSGSSGTSIASLAFSAGSSLVKGYGEMKSQEFLAARDKRAAEIGKLRAEQVDTQRREELGTTLANIEVVRAAGNVDPLSPTTAAIKSNEARISDRQRTTEVSNILAQAAEDEASSAFRLKAGKRALTASYLDAAGKLLKG